MGLIGDKIVPFLVWNFEQKKENELKELLNETVIKNHVLILNTLQGDFAEIYRLKSKSMKIKIEEMPVIDVPGKKILARCDYKHNIIYVSPSISKAKIQHAIMHEQYHLGSSDPKRYKCGLYQVGIIGAAINEGFTEYLVQQTLSNYDYTTGTDYVKYIKLIFLLCKSGFRNQLEHNYFVGSIYILIKQLGDLLDLPYDLVIKYFLSLDLESYCNSLWKIPFNESDLGDSKEIQSIFVDRCYSYIKEKNNIKVSNQ